MDDYATRKDVRLPLYNINAVARRVGLNPATLRAWERRYGSPRPCRGSQGYRLYSEEDVRVLHWLKSQVEHGVRIHRAVALLQESQAAGNNPAPESLDPPPSFETLRGALTTALLGLDDGRAAEILQAALAAYPLEQVFSGVVRPILTNIGRYWQIGEVPVASEHFASQFFMQHLMHMLATAPQPWRPGVIVAACAPGEDHQIGLLMLVLLLRRRGREVKYLGPSLALDRLEEALRPLPPPLLVFSATCVENTHKLKALPRVLKRFPRPQPRVILGGQAFQNARLSTQFPAIYLADDDLLPAVEKIEAILDSHLAESVR